MPDETVSKSTFLMEFGSGIENPPNPPANDNQNLYVGSAVNGWHDIFGDYKTGLAAEPGRKVFLVLVTQQAYDVGNEIQQIVNSLGTEIYGGIGKLKHLLQITLHKQYHKTQTIQQNNTKKYY